MVVFEYVIVESDVADSVLLNGTPAAVSANVDDVNHCGIVEITKELEYKAPAEFELNTLNE